MSSKEHQRSCIWREVGGVGGRGVGMCQAGGGDGCNAEHVDGLPGNN